MLWNHCDLLCFGSAFREGMHIFPGDTLLWVCGGNQQMQRLCPVIPKELGPGSWLLWVEYLSKPEDTDVFLKL